jgi:hypothetical protein
MIPDLDERGYLPPGIPLASTMDAQGGGGGGPMTLSSQREVENARHKLRLLEQHYQETLERPCENEHVQELTLLSLKRIINQMKEEIAVFECHAVATPTGGR